MDRARALVAWCGAHFHVEIKSVAFLKISMVMNSVRTYLYSALVGLLPPTRCFRLKSALLRWAGATVGSGVRIVSSARFITNGKLEIGDDTWIGHEVLIVGGDADVIIGANVDIAPRATLVTGSHELSTGNVRAAGRGYSTPIHIEDGAWIGANVTILGGVTIGRCAIVAAGALVNKDVSPMCVVAGVPARQIRSHESST